jgi:hypothetical protein
LKEVFGLVLEFREEKRTFAKLERGNVDFFLKKLQQGALSLLVVSIYNHSTPVNFILGFLGCELTRWLDASLSRTTAGGEMLTFPSH